MQVKLNPRLLENIERFLNEQTDFAKRHGKPNPFEDGTDLSRAMNLLSAIITATKQKQI